MKKANRTGPLKACAVLNDNPIAEGCNVSLDSIPVPAGVEVALLEKFPGYAVGTDGSVWSRWRKGPFRKMGDVWKKLAAGPNKAGYPQVNLSGKIVHVHLLILETFVGPCPEGLEACHEDGNPGNNAVTNLRWDTHKANMADKERHGTNPKGEDHASATLTNSQVVEIRVLWAQGKKVPWLAAQFHASESVVKDVVYNRRWKHLL